MAYNPLIPQPGDKLKDSQPQIQDNFAQIKTVIDINHDTFGSVTQGKHKFVTMPTQPAAPVTAAGEGDLYTKLSALSGVPELFFRRQSAGTELEFTAADLTASPGWAKLPCGLIIQWGLSAINPVAYNIAFPKTFPTACFGIMGGIKGTTVDQWAYYNPLPATFQATTLTQNIWIFWIAIGS
jgi:hypothetical protein